MEMVLDRIGFCPETPPKYEVCQDTLWSRSECFEYSDAKSSESTETLEKEFSRLAPQWKKETAGWSSIARRYSTESYQSILALGEGVIPSILAELKREPDYWFAALRVLSKENPVGLDVSFSQAVDGWLKWGRQKGHLD